MKNIKNLLEKENYGWVRFLTSDEKNNLSNYLKNKITTRKFLQVIYGSDVVEKAYNEKPDKNGIKRYCKLLTDDIDNIMVICFVEYVAGKDYIRTIKPLTI